MIWQCVTVACDKISPALRTNWIARIVAIRVLYWKNILLMYLASLYVFYVPFGQKATFDDN